MARLASVKEDEYEFARTQALKKDSCVKDKLDLLFSWHCGMPQKYAVMDFDKSIWFKAL